MNLCSLPIRRRLRSDIKNKQFWPLSWRQKQFQVLFSRRDKARNRQVSSCPFFCFQWFSIFSHITSNETMLLETYIDTLSLINNLTHSDTMKSTHEYVKNTKTNPFISNQHEWIHRVFELVCSQSCLWGSANVPIGTIPFTLSPLKG